MLTVKMNPSSDWIFISESTWNVAGREGQNRSTNALIRSRSSGLRFMKRTPIPTPSWTYRTSALTKSNWFNKLV